MIITKTIPIVIIIAIISDNHPNEDEIVKLEKLIQCSFCLINSSNLEISVHFVGTNF